MGRENEVVVNRKYKDTVFRMVFREKKELLSLYNAVNGTSYDNPEALEIVTLENAIYMNVKNDVAFIMDFQMYLYEHQSTYNPNIPLRDLLYVSKEYHSLVDQKTLYGKWLVKIPTPNFVVFYNGIEERPEREILKLSDAFEKPVEEPSLELKVLVLNINEGMNTEFLRKNRGEAIMRSIFEYDEEETMKQLRQGYREEGIKEGIKRGSILERELIICNALKNHSAIEVAEFNGIPLEEVLEIEKKMKR